VLIVEEVGRGDSSMRTVVLVQPFLVCSAAAAAGKAVFTGAGACATCHTLAAAGATGFVGPNLDMRLKSDCATPKSQAIRGKTLAQCIQTAITKPYAYLPSGFSAA
jgi:cytochrome c2